MDCENEWLIAATLIVGMIGLSVFAFVGVQQLSDGGSPWWGAAVVFDVIYLVGVGYLIHGDGEDLMWMP